MRFIIIVYLASLSHVSLSANNALELNSDNLTLYALKYSSQDVMNEYAISLLKKEHSKDYFQAMNDKAQLKILFNKSKSELKKSIEPITSHQEFSFTKKIKFKVNNKEHPTLQIKSILPHYIHTLFRSYDINQGLPDYYRLLISNLEILNNIKISADKFEELVQSNINSLYIDVRFIISKYQNQQDFQASIKKIIVYTDKQKQNQISIKTSGIDHDEQVNNWLVSDGFTTKLAGIHAFSLMGYRLQDSLMPTLLSSNVCEKTKRVNNHQILLCKHNFTNNSYIVTVFLGGILAQLDLIVSNQIEQGEINNIIKNLSAGLKEPKSFFKDTDKKWNKYSVDFEFFPINFSTNYANINYKLIFRMASQATQQILKGNL